MGNVQRMEPDPTYAKTLEDHGFHMPSAKQEDMLKHLCIDERDLRTQAIANNGMVSKQQYVTCMQHLYDTSSDLIPDMVPQSSAELQRLSWIP